MLNSLWVFSSPVNVILSPQYSNMVVKSGGFLSRFVTCSHLFSDRTDGDKKIRAPLSKSDVESNSNKNMKKPMVKDDKDSNSSTPQNSSELSKDLELPSDGQIPFRRRSFMAPGSRIASLLPEQYWQSVREDRKIIEKTAGKVVGDLRKEKLVNLSIANANANPIEKDVDFEGKVHHKPESSGHEISKMFSSSTKSVLPEKSYENVPHLSSRFRRHRGLNVSSRLHQMMENAENFPEKDTDIREENQEIPCKDGNGK